MAQYSLTPPSSQQTLTKNDGQVDWQLTMVKRGCLVDATIQLAFKTTSVKKIELPLLPEGYRPVHDMITIPLAGSTKAAGNAFYYAHDDGGNEVYPTGTTTTKYFTHAMWMTGE